MKRINKEYTLGAYSFTQERTVPVQKYVLILSSKLAKPLLSSDIRLPEKSLNYYLYFPIRSSVRGLFLYGIDVIREVLECNV